LILTGLTHKTKETGFLAGDFADKINIYRSETRFLRKSYLINTSTKEKATRVNSWPSVVPQLLILTVVGGEWVISPKLI